MKQGWDRRSRDRWPTVLSGSFRENGRGAARVTVLNLSPNGCKVDLGDHSRIRAQAWMKLPTLESRFAEIIWQRGQEAGLEFEEPLHPAVASMLVERSAREGAQVPLNARIPPRSNSAGSRAGSFPGIG
jgi:hypothetical protein